MTDLQVRVTRIICEEIAPALQLDGTGITTEGLENLSKLSTLEVLSLDDTSIGDEAEPYLMRMKGLRVLSLAGSRVSAASIAKLRAALADCEIRTGAR